MTETFLFLDTETTGFHNKSAARDPSQGRVCQLALILCDENKETIMQTCVLIKPDGWKIQPGAQAVHGITDEQCERHGIPSTMAYMLFDHFANRANWVVAHNLAFDQRMLEIEAEAHGVLFPYLNNPVCTMKATTDICKIPGARGYKWPKLAEAMPIICGRPMSNKAHNAMVDAIACRDIFFAMRKGSL